MRWRVMYDEIREHPAWKDFNYRIEQARQATLNQLLIFGGLDKSGEKRDIELRAVLHVLNTILGYVPSVRAECEKLEKRFEQMERRKSERSPMHGKDQPLS